MLKTLDLPRLNIEKTYEDQFYYLKKMTKSEFEIILSMEKIYKRKKEYIVFQNKIKRNIYNILIFIHHFILFYSCYLKLTKFCAFLIKISFHQPKSLEMK